MVVVVVIVVVVIVVVAVVGTQCGAKNRICGQKAKAAQQTRRDC